MYIRNRKAFLICVIVAIVANVLAFVIKKYDEWFFVIAWIAGLLCGAIPIVLSAFKAIFSKFSFGSCFGVLLGILLAAWGVCIVAAVAVALPGLIAIIGWFKYGMDV